MNSHPPPGTGYFVPHPDSSGPLSSESTQAATTHDGPRSVLLIPSPWGLTPECKAKAHELADAGFNVLVPDLNDGVVATDEEHAHTLLMEADMNVTASLVQSSLRLLQMASEDASVPVGILGYAAGASWALWLSVRFPTQCAAVTTFYGTQTISFDESQASYLLHFAESDPHVSEEDRALMGLNLQMARRDFKVEIHTGVAAGFAEGAHPNFDGAAEAIAWRQTLEFFAAALR